LVLVEQAAAVAAVLTVLVWLMEQPILVVAAAVQVQ
jgi:hypothetical protein